MEVQEEDMRQGEPGILRKLVRREKLEAMFLFVTSRCNSNCRTCFYHDELNSHQDERAKGEVNRLAVFEPYSNRQLWN